MRAIFMMMKDTLKLAVLFVLLTRSMAFAQDLTAASKPAAIDFHRFDGSFTLQSQSLGMNCAKVIHVAADDKTKEVPAFEENEGRQVTITDGDGSMLVLNDINYQYPKGLVDHFFSQVNFFVDENIVEDSSTPNKIAKKISDHGDRSYTAIEKRDSNSIDLTFDAGACHYSRSGI